MDKSEYKLRAEEIKDLISRGEYAQAAEIADTIDWKKVRNANLLCKKCHDVVYDQRPL